MRVTGNLLQGLQSEDKWLMGLKMDALHKKDCSFFVCLVFCFSSSFWPSQRNCLRSRVKMAIEFSRIHQCLSCFLLLSKTDLGCSEHVFSGPL